MVSLVIKILSTYSLVTAANKYFKTAKDEEKKKEEVAKFNIAQPPTRVQQQQPQVVAGVFSVATEDDDTQVELKKDSL